ncbi:MAG TPA: hypothetical protein VN661_04245 [Candidatus Acidoferrales bacterium]|nr:hypothetical protein [Candidatus Acidoferrales bacterium]
MKPADSVPCDRHPDFLKRFVPAPFRAIVRAGALAISLETNDSGCLSALAAAGRESPSEPYERFHWTMIRDEDAPGGIVGSIDLADEHLTFVNMGPACLVGLDAKRRELLAFIGADVDEHLLAESILPLFLRLTRAAIAPRSFTGDEHRHAFQAALIHE